MTRENDRVESMKVLNDGLGRALDDPAFDMPLNRDQERILRSEVRAGLLVDRKGPPVGRRCGDCQLCCKLTPVKELEKGANERCKFQRTGKGCTIYDRRPNSCRVWNCQWLVDEDTAELSRPDRSHYVVDVLPDYVTMTWDDRPPMHIPVMQVWVDPLFPDAHRDPALRALVMKRGETGMATIIRYGARDGFVLFPPNMSQDGQWHEEGSRADFTREKSLIEMVEAGEFQMTTTFTDEDGNKMHASGGDIEIVMKQR